MTDTVFTEAFCYGNFKKIDAKLWVQQRTIHTYTKVEEGIVIVTLHENDFFPMLTHLRKSNVNVKTVICGQEKDKINKEYSKLTVLLRQSRLEWAKYLVNKLSDLENILVQDDSVILTRSVIKNQVIEKLASMGANIHNLCAQDISQNKINEIVSKNCDKWNVILAVYSDLPTDYPPSAKSWEFESTGIEHYVLPQRRGSYRVITDEYNLFRMKDISLQNCKEPWPRKMSFGRKNLLESLGIGYPLKIYNIQTSELEHYVASENTLYGAISHRWLGSILKYKSWKDMLIHANSVYTKCRTHFETKGIKLQMLNKWWLDTVCINQGDLAEKMQEIPKMGRVYRESAFVVAVLDDLDVKTFDDIAIQVKNTSYSTSMLFEFITSSQWWQRGWTLQEWMLAMNIIFIVPGSDEWITNSDFETSVTCYNNKLDTQIKKQVHDRRQLSHAPFLLYSDVTNMMVNRSVGMESDRVYCTSGICYIAITSSGHTPYDLQICCRMAAVLAGDLDILTMIEVEGANIVYMLKSNITIYKAYISFDKDGYMQIKDAHISKVSTSDDVNNCTTLGINTLLTYSNERWDNMMETNEEDEECIYLSEYSMRLTIVKAGGREFCCVITNFAHNGKKMFMVKITADDELSDKLRYICVRHQSRNDVYYKIGIVVSGSKVPIVSDMIDTIKVC